MRSTYFLFFLFFFASTDVEAIVYAKIENFVDVELNKKYFLIDCSNRGGKNTLVGFNLLDEDIYYHFYYRGIRSVKRCNELRKEYMSMLKGHDFVRIVGNGPDESIILDSDRKKLPFPFSNAKKIISSVFIRLQAGNKCKAYFLEDCELPQRYWARIDFLLDPFRE